LSGECKRIAREHGDLVALEKCSAENEHLRCDERAAFCPLYRTMAKWKSWGIPERERQLLRDDILGKKPLKPRLALQVARARLQRRSGPGGLKGNETLLVLAGKCGVGKTVAGTWVLSRTGGLYVTAFEFSSVSLDRALLKRVSTLVIDQFGTEPIGETEWALGHLLDVIDCRYANLRLTILCTNMLRSELEGCYSNILKRRLDDDGIFVRLGDAS
jgi:hypothetical protein